MRRLFPAFPGKNKRKCANRQKGATLVELVVCCALLVLLGTALAGLMRPAMTTSRLSKALSEDRMIARAILSHAAGELRFASPNSVTLEGDGVAYRNPSFGAASIRNSAGRVSVVAGEAELGLEEDAYMGRTAEIAFLQQGADRIDITVTVLRAGEKTYALSEAVRLLNQRETN